MARQNNRVLLETVRCSEHQYCCGKYARLDVAQGIVTSQITDKLDMVNSVGKGARLFSILNIKSLVKVDTEVLGKNTKGQSRWCVDNTTQYQLYLRERAHQGCLCQRSWLEVSHTCQTTLFFFPPSLGQRLTQIKMGDGNLTKEPSRFTQIAPAIKLYFSIVLCHSCTDIEKLTVFQRGKRVFLMFCRVTQFEEHCGSPDTWVHTVPSALLCGRSNFEAF